MIDYKKYVRSLIANKSLNFPDRIGWIKTAVSPNDYREALKMHPMLIHFFKQKLHFEKPEDITQREPFSYTDDFKREFRWISILVEEHFGILNEFIGLKSEFEKNIVVNDLNGAKQLLATIEINFGITLWSIESNLLVEELTNGSEANWNKLSEYLNKIKNAFYEFIINAASKRTESNLSYETFLAQFQNDIDNTHASSVVTDFFVFKNLPISNYEYASKSLSSVLYISELFGVIDQYLILIDVIAYHVLDPEFSVSYFTSFLNKAKRSIPNDSTLQNLYYVVSNHKDLKSDFSPSNIVECLDHFYTGRFKRALQLAEIGMIEAPLEFEFYEVYCKSLINLGENPTPSNNFPFQGTMINDLFELLNFRESYEGCMKRLLKQAIMLCNFGFGKQLYLILSEMDGLKSRHNKIGALYASYPSIKILEKGKLTPELSSKFSSLLNHACYGVSLFKSGAEIDVNQIEITSTVQLNMTTAIHYFNNGSFAKVIDELCKSNELDVKNYYFERKLNLLFDSYVELKNYKEALKIFSKVIFSKDLISKKNNYYQLYSALKSSDLREDIHDIALPILFSFIVNEYDLFEVFDEFMEKEGYLNIGDVDVNDMISKYSLEKFIYFLEKVATVDTLKYSTDYFSISEVEEARINILKTLISINKKDKLTYENEINDIYRINSVRKALKEVDEGRLYIDVNALKNFQVKSFSEDYKRFKEIESISSNQNLIGFNASTVRNWDPNAVLDEKNQSYNSASYLAFKNIYLEVRDNFLFSKEYGLESCLSTRIRHGALKNHIRSVFEKLDLVTSKSQTGYLDNQVWAGQLQERLKKFSSEIDLYTSAIVDTLLQIKTEKIADRPDALFQYMTHDELLFSFYMTNNSRFDSIETTVEILLTDLVNYTLINVGEDVVNAFTKGTISQRFQEIIESLLGDLKDEDLPYGCDLISNVMKSTTDIQNELEYLAEWFYLNTTSPSTLLSMETILNASLNLTNRINPLFNLSPIIKIEKDFAGYSSLIFVFNILLNNVISHSNLENDEINLTIEVKVSNEEGYALISFKNNLNSEFDYSANRQKLEQVKANWNNHHNIDRSNKEGESGYDKIKRMLIYETLTKTDRFEYELENDSISITLFFPYIKPK
jgi:hypothetical protein